MKSFKKSMLNSINAMSSAINNLAQAIRSLSNPKNQLPVNSTVTSNPTNVKVKYYTSDKDQINGYPYKENKKSFYKDENFGNYASLSIFQRQSLYKVYRLMNDDPDLSSLNYMKIHWPHMYKALESLKKPSYDPYIWQSKDNKF